MHCWKTTSSLVWLFITGTYLSGEHHQCFINRKVTLPH